MPDGSLLFGQLGVLAVDGDTGQVQCAACGRWLRALGGAHLIAAHGLTAETYRERYGLVLRRALEAPDRRARRSASTRARVKREPRLREMLERGAAAARSGELAARTRGTMGERGRRSAQRLERQQLLADNSRRGVAAVQAASDQRLVLRARELGFTSLEGYLRDRHAAGWSVLQTSAELAVAREKTARLLAALGLPGMLDREHPAELAALRGVGAPNLAAFLRAQHAAGVPVAATARALGHSPPWLALRARRDGLAELLVPGLTAEQRAAASARQAGFADAASWLAHRRASGEPSRTLQAQTGLSPQRLARLLRDGGIASPTALYQQRVLARVGFTDLASYAHERVEQGWTVLRMSQELVVGDTWLARRLRAHDLGHLIGPKGRKPRAQTAALQPGPGTRT